MKLKPVTFDEKKVLIFLFPYLFVGYLADKVFWLYRHQEGETAFWRAAAALQKLNDAFANPLPSFWPIDLLAGIAGALLFAAFKYLHDLDKKKLRQGVEYGSARWGTSKDIAPFVDPDPEQNIILTRTEGLTMKPFGCEPKYSRNKNVLVIGGSGSGKTRFFVKPNLMQMHSSYVVTDPKGYSYRGQKNYRVLC